MIDQKVMSLSVSVLSAAVLALPVISAQADEVQTSLQRHVWKSGQAESHGAQAAASHRLNFAGASGMRIHFDQVTLGQGAYIRVTTNRGRQGLRMDDRILREFKYTSPYINGDQALVELVLPNGMRSAGIGIRGVEVLSLKAGPESICGKDDRTPSQIKSIARMMQVANGSGGCTGTLISNSCMVSAGHCSDYLNIAQFNVPVSNDNGTPNFPGPEDQYPLAKIYGFKDGGQGNDWSVYRISPNPVTRKVAGASQGFYKVGNGVIPPAGSILRITGFGVATGRMNVAQQTHTGTVTRNTGPHLQYEVDTMPGNSGSTIILESTQEIIGIHTHGGCSSTPGTANSGTLLALSPDFQKAIQQCLADDRGN